MKKVIILGGGISALSFAYFLHQQHRVETIIIEEKPFFGGWIQTQSIEYLGQTTLFEKGPRALSLAPGDLTFKLLQALQLQPYLLAAATAPKYLFLQGKLQPCTAYMMCKLLGLSLIQELWKAPYHQEESIQEFFARRFNSKFVQMMVDPLVRGIFGGDIKTLSMQACFPHMKLLEQRYGSVIKGLWKERKKKKLYSFTTGMQMLVHALLQHIPSKLYPSTQVLEINPQGFVVTNQGCFEADMIVSTLPLHRLHRLCPLAPLCSYNTLSVVHVGWTQKKLPPGFGYLVPSSEHPCILGMSWDSNLFTAHNGALLSRASIFIKNQADPALIQHALSHQVHIQEPPDYINSYEASYALPQYTLGHQQRVSTRRINNMLLIGAGFEGASVQACIDLAYRTAMLPCFSSTGSFSNIYHI